MNCAFQLNLSSGAAAGWKRIRLPLYPFGCGLSYTDFAYGELRLSAERVRAGETVSASFIVTNTGRVPGTAVPQIYLRDMVSSTVKPEWLLAAFTRVALAPGETRTVSLEIPPRMMRTLEGHFRWSVEPGEFRASLGENAEALQMEQTFFVE